MPSSFPDEGNACKRLTVVGRRALVTGPGSVEGVQIPPVRQSKLWRYRKKSPRWSAGRRACPAHGQAGAFAKVPRLPAPFRRSASLREATERPGRARENGQGNLAIRAKHRAEPRALALLVAGSSGLPAKRAGLTCRPSSEETRHRKRS